MQYWNFISSLPFQFCFDFSSNSTHFLQTDWRLIHQQYLNYFLQRSPRRLQLHAGITGRSSKLVFTQQSPRWMRAVFSSLQYTVSNTFNTQHILQRRQCQQGRTHFFDGHSRCSRSQHRSQLPISLQRSLHNLHANVWEHNIHGPPGSMRA